MHIIDRIAKTTAQEACAIIDWVALAWEQRQRSRQETAFVAYQIGHRHLPLESGEQGLKTLYEPILETYLEQQGLPVEHTQLPFTRVSATSRHSHS
jgi:urease accessory protein UreE